jgi:Mu transposase, C-terminal
MDRLFLRLYPQPRQVSSKGIPAFGLHYWSASLAGIERIDRTGRAVEYQFRYDPADFSRISLFRDGEWVGDGSARELQQADGTVRHLSLAEWKMARSEGKTAGELALVSEVQALAKQRTAEKKAAQRIKGKRSPQAPGELRQDTTPIPSEAPDAETERILRFLHGGE